MATVNDQIGTMTDEEFFRQLQGKHFKRLTDFEHAVHAVAWESYPAFLPTQIFDSKRYAQLAIDRGWVHKAKQGGLYVDVPPR